jgi:hypothetical protein
MSPTATTAAIATALIAGPVAIARKLLPPNHDAKPEHITRAEFHEGINAMRIKGRLTPHSAFRPPHSGTRTGSISGGLVSNRKPHT